MKPYEQEDIPTAIARQGLERILQRIPPGYALDYRPEPTARPKGKREAVE